MDPLGQVKGPELLGSYVCEIEANIGAVFEASRPAAIDLPSQYFSVKGKNGIEEDIDIFVAGYTMVHWHCFWMDWIYSHLAEERLVMEMV